MKGWPTKPLEEIAELYGGSTPSRDSPAFWGGDIYWVTPTDLPIPDEGISVVSKTKDRITQAGLDNSSATLVPKGTVLFSSRATIGKVAVADMPLTTNQGFANFVPHSEVTSRFLAYALWFHREDIARLSGSTTFKEVSRSTLRKYHLPVPPLAEQERIVKLLDEADELRKLRAQADHRTTDLIPALFSEMFGDVAESRNGLSIVPLGSLLSFKTGKLDSNAAVKSGAYPFFTCSREDSRIDTFAFDGEALLLAGNNATGDYSVKHYKGKFNAYQRTYVLSLLNVDHSYAFMQQAIQLKLQDLKRLSLGTNTKYLTLGILKNIQIALPAPEQQKEFAARVSEIRAMQAERAASRRRLDDPFQSMLHRAFQGEL